MESALRNCWSAGWFILYGNLSILFLTLSVALAVSAAPAGERMCLQRIRHKANLRFRSRSALPGTAFSLTIECFCGQRASGPGRLRT